MDGEDFEFVVKNVSPNGVQAILTYDGENEPFAFFFAHRVTESGYAGSLVFLDAVDKLDELPWQPTALNVADILDTNMQVQLDRIEVFSRFEPTNIGQPEIRQNRVNRDSPDYDSYALQVDACAEEDYEDGEADEEDYWPVAKLECVMDSEPPVVAILMQDPTLCTDDNVQHFVDWLWRSLGWKEDVAVAICMPAQSLGLLQLGEPDTNAE
ncbi:MAG: hypothetical protein ACK5PZ_10650 [Pirellula sp.]|jgi:hypothetical protein